MIVIYTSKVDISTYRITEWLRFFDIDFVILNEETQIDNMILSISNEEDKLSFQLGENQMIQFEKVFFRRFNGFKFRKPKVKNEEDKENLNSISFFDYLSNELNVITNSILSYTKNKAALKIGNFVINSDLNKIEVLLAAKKVGLLIPNTAIFINQVLNKDFKLNKPITEIFSEAINGYVYETSGSSLLNQLNYKTNFPSLLQYYIEKKFEVRSLFIGDKFYSMAIFSQQSNKTKIDFRNYDKEKPNRCVPFDLPLNVKYKVRKLMQNLNLNTGSLDFIVNADGEYIFLEVNSEGQFDWLSFNCNYYVEKKIINYYNHV